MSQSEAPSLGERFSSVKYQIFATIVANVCCLGQGTAVGWTSPSIPILLSESAPLSAPISVEIGAWIVAALPLGAFFGTFLYGTLLNFIGSKRSLLLCAIPLSIHWIIVYFAKEAWMLIVARFVTGLTGGGVFICIPLFVAEIANERVRGQLSSLMQLSFNGGIVLGYVAGSFLTYDMVPWILILLPIAFSCVFIWFPSTPQYLLKNHDSKKAIRSLRFYRNIRKDVNVRKEQQLQAEFEKFEMIAKQNAELPPVQLSDFRTREAIRGMIIGPVMLAVAQFGGAFTLSSYANTIFRESGTAIDPNLSSIVLGSIQVMGTCCASSLIDRLGRKFLLLVSCAGSAVGLLVTGIYAYLNQLEDYDMSAFSVLPLVSLSFFIFISAVGLAPVPYVLVAEVLPPKIRRIGATICICTVFVYAFIMLRFFPAMLAAFQLHGCMLFFACVSVAGFVFTWLVVEETKGKNLHQLQTLTKSADDDGSIDNSSVGKMSINRLTATKGNV